VNNRIIDELEMNGNDCFCILFIARFVSSPAVDHLLSYSLKSSPDSLIDFPSRFSNTIVANTRRRGQAQEESRMRNTPLPFTNILLDTKNLQVKKTVKMTHRHRTTTMKTVGVISRRRRKLLTQKNSSINTTMHVTFVCWEGSYSVARRVALSFTRSVSDPF
jgi:hypothetical protein